MARGPTPKDPGARQRRNKASTAAVLEAPSPDEAEERRPPTLPLALFGGLRIHRLTRAWWKVIWRSPMAPRFLEADVEGLLLVARLKNDFFNTSDAGLAARLAAEIRQQETRFGLTPIDRRRLDWRIEGPRQNPPAQPVPDAEAFEEELIDPRRALRAVK